MKAWTTLLFGALMFLYGCSDPSAKTMSAGQYTPSTKAASREGNFIRFAKESPQLSRIAVSPAEIADVPVDELLAPAKVELNPGRVSRVVPPVAGRVREVLVVLGDRVAQGQVVMTLDSRETPAIESAVRQAEADVRQNQAQLQKAEADLSRVRDLFANRAIAQKEVLAAETVLAQAKANLEQAQAGRDEAIRRMQLLGLHPGNMAQLISVRAPVSGNVVNVAVAPGEFRNDTTAAVLTIADLTSVWISADVPESAIRLIAIGAPVSITLPAFPDRTFAGRVNRIGDVVDAQTRTIKVRVEMPNTNQQLRPEMFATARFTHGLARSVVIPKSALYQQQDRTTVFSQRGPGVFEEVTVKVTWQDERRAAIAAGVAQGDHIVTDGVTLLLAY